MPPFETHPNRESLLAYAAGLIDGEGCIGTYYNKVTKNYQLRITVEMVEKEGLVVLEKLFGGKWYYKEAKIPRRARHLWMLFGSEAEKALKELQGYLLIKNKQANEVLKADWSGFIGKPLSDEQVSIRESVNIEIKKLNKRGYYGN